jgi:hypothetical protein
VLSAFGCGAYANPPLVQAKENYSSLTTSKTKGEKNISFFYFSSYLIDFVFLKIQFSLFQHIARLFREVIQKFDGKFKMVIFAILNDANSFKEHNRDGNIAPFEKVKVEHGEEKKLFSSI